ncbi:iron complex transport system substrate-binding protein [Azospirillum fermentarium]|uniref:heme/hemin ABC transporter substrate-binding protein n=1 Tax=Azospirillum fermentarium TaxID=1233114 RepID=UPI002225B81E|nr:ABC transporter substrate-binding protein [Azospirillum fermentarium]MCW2248969.1 iron complex transport system substrate-binding protein [Azospirillum fermentarium]
MATLRPCLRRVAAALAAAGALLSPAAVAADGLRLITIGAPVTELAFALGAGEAVIARDTVSRYPAEAAARPDAGYMRTLSAEGLMSLTPTHVLAVEGAGPPAAFDQLRAMGVAVETIPDAPGLPGLSARIAAVARTLGRPAEGERLAAAVERKFTALATAVDAARRARTGTIGARVLCLVGGGPGGMMAAGRGTVPDTLITLAGARNAMDSEREFPPLSAEAALAAEPDILLVGRSLVDRSGGIDGLVSLPQLAMTPAARDRRVVVIDGGLFVGLGPRSPDAVAALLAAQGVTVEGMTP